MAENSTAYSIITTAAGVLLATVLIAILGTTVLLWLETNASNAAAAASPAAVAALAGEATVAPAPTEAPVAPDEAQPAAEAPAAPDDAAAALAKGTCTGCHVIPGVPNANGLVGPNLTHIGTVAATRVEGQTAEEYLHTSIVAPDEYIVAECPTGPCPANVMLPTFGQMLSDAELNSVVAYLLTLQ